ncbi:MAG: MFS transporter [Patescibacteria group bacterium]|mgnify:CR=1 FL=1
MFKNNPNLKNIFLAGFLFSLHLALTSYVNSSFLSFFLKEKNVGLLYTLGFIVSIIALLLIPKILIKIGSYKFLLWSVGLNAISLLFLSISKSIWLIIPIFVSYLTLNTIIIFSLDELLLIFSKNYGVGKIRGLYIAIISAAWVLAQSVSGTILNNFSFSALYFISFVVMALFFIVSFFFLRKSPDPNYDRTPISESLKIFFKNKNLTRAFKINFFLQFFYAFMIIYTPIYLNAHLGFTWSEIGVIFTIMLTPFVILPFFLGKYSDKIGERRMLIFGFTLVSLATLSLFFITQREIWIWILILFITRIGASTIEIMSDIYFFKHIAPENDEFIGIYRNAAPVAFIFAPLVAIIIFSLTPSFNFIFLILGAMMLLGIYLSSTIQKSDV